MAENQNNAAAEMAAEMESKAPAVSEHLEEMEDIEDDNEDLPDYNSEIENNFGKNPPSISQPTTAETAVSGSFNPDIHAVDDQGKPIMSKTRPGEFQRKRGRPSKVRQVIPVEDLVRKSARQCTAGIITIGCVAFGAEWIPQSDPATGADERAILTAAFEEYFRAGDVINVPPWLGLAIALAGYAGPRLWLPQTQARIAEIKAKILGMKAKKPA